MRQSKYLYVASIICNLFRCVLFYSLLIFPLIITSWIFFCLFFWCACNSSLIVDDKNDLKNVHTLHLRLFFWKRNGYWNIQWTRSRKQAIFIWLYRQNFYFFRSLSRKIFYAKLKMKCCLLCHHYQIACECKDRVRKRERASESGTKSALIASSSFD